MSSAEVQAIDPTQNTKPGLYKPPTRLTYSVRELLDLFAPTDSLPEGFTYFQSVTSLKCLEPVNMSGEVSIKKDERVNPDFKPRRGATPWTRGAKAPARGGARLPRGRGSSTEVTSPTNRWGSSSSGGVGRGGRRQWRDREGEEGLDATMGGLSLEDKPSAPLSEHEKQEQEMKAAAASPDLCWMYRQKGTLHGPFSLKQIKSWHEAGYFDSDVTVKKIGSGTEFVPVATALAQESSKAEAEDMFSDPAMSHIKSFISGLTDSDRTQAPRSTSPHQLEGPPPVQPWQYGGYQAPTSTMGYGMYPMPPFYGQQYPPQMMGRGYPMPPYMAPYPPMGHSPISPSDMGGMPPFMMHDRSMTDPAQVEMMMRMMAMQQMAPQPQVPQPGSTAPGQPVQRPEVVSVPAMQPTQITLQTPPEPAKPQEKPAATPTPAKTERAKADSAPAVEKKTEEPKMKELKESHNAEIQKAKELLKQVEESTQQLKEDKAKAPAAAAAQPESKKKKKEKKEKKAPTEDLTGMQTVMPKRKKKKTVMEIPDAIEEEELPIPESLKAKAPIVPKTSSLPEDTFATYFGIEEPKVRINPWAKAAPPVEESTDLSRIMKEHKKATMSEDQIRKQKFKAERAKQEAEETRRLNPWAGAVAAAPAPSAGVSMSAILKAEKSKTKEEPKKAKKASAAAGGGSPAGLWSAIVGTSVQRPPNPEEILGLASTPTKKEEKKPAAPSPAPAPAKPKAKEEKKPAAAPAPAPEKKKKEEKKPAAAPSPAPSPAKAKPKAKEEKKPQPQPQAKKATKPIEEDEDEDDLFWDYTGKTEKPKAAPQGDAANLGSIEPSPEFKEWCKRELKKLTKKDDLTLMYFLLGQKKAEDVKAYAKLYLRDTPDVESFADEFVRLMRFESSGGKTKKRKT